MPARLRRWLPWLLLVPFLAVALLRVDLARVLGVLRGASPALVAGAVLVNLALRMTTRIQGTRTLLARLPRTGRPIPRLPLTRLVFGSHAARNLLAGPVGSALLALELSRWGYGLDGLLAAQLFEGVADVVSLGFSAALLLLVVPPAALARWALMRSALAVAVVLGVAVLVAVVVAARSKGSPGPEPPAGGRVLRALCALRRRARLAARWILVPRVWVPALFWSVATDFADAAMLGLCLEAVGVSVGLRAWLWAFVSIRILIAVPLTPGQLGLLETAAVLSLGVFGVSAPDALAAALLYRVTRVLPVVLGGVILFPLSLSTPTEGCSPALEGRF
jgi:uncharacterized membrane protein YbhN (UPF0104 family)